MYRMRSQSGRRLSSGSGFTIVELLVVISIISLLMALVLPALGRAREVAFTVRCMSNLKQVGIAASAYSADNSNFMLPGNVDPTASQASSHTNISWHRLLYVQYMNNGGGAMQCPSIPIIGTPGSGTDKRNRGQFNPTNSSTDPRFAAAEWQNTASSPFTAASYIMNLMPNSPLVGSGWTTGSLWSGATELQAGGYDPRRIRGWTSYNSQTPGSFPNTDYDAYPLRLDKARAPGATAFILEHRPDVYNPTATETNFTTFMQSGINDFRHTDWTATLDPATNPRLKVGRFVHTSKGQGWLSASTTNANVNDVNSFNVLHGDFHVETLTKTTQLSWVAAID